MILLVGNLMYDELLFLLIHTLYMCVKSKEIKMNGVYHNLTPTSQLLFTVL